MPLTMPQYPPAVLIDKISVAIECGDEAGGRLAGLRAGRSRVQAAVRLRPELDCF